MTTHPNARRAKGTPKSLTDACRRAEIPPTYRQWRKWCQCRGLAHRIAQQGA